jgi:phytoene synthase
LAGIRSDLKAAFSCLPEVQAFIALAKRCRIDDRLPLLLVEAIESDTGQVRIASWEGLIRFCYGVASTVGLMMCAVMGVRNPAALPFAVDLGIAMQLTNIARDVVEDAERDRVYLPGEWLGPGIEPHQIIAGEPAARRCIAGARKRLLGRAAQYYRSADSGMRFLPLRARLAVLTAARLYEAIGHHVQGEALWGDRAFVGAAEKIWRTIGAVGSVLFNPAYRHAGRPPVHDDNLHKPLNGLPGTSGGS